MLNQVFDAPVHFLCMQMACDKLAEGIKGFSVDQGKLEALLAAVA